MAVTALRIEFSLSNNMRALGFHDGKSTATPVFAKDVLQQSLVKTTFGDDIFFAARRGLSRILDPGNAAVLDSFAQQVRDQSPGTLAQNPETAWEGTIVFSVSNVPPAESTEGWQRFKEALGEVARLGVVRMRVWMAESRPQTIRCRFYCFLSPCGPFSALRRGSVTLTVPLNLLEMFGIS